MIAIYVLIGFSLLASMFFTIVGIVGIIGGIFGFHIDLDIPFFEEEYREEKKAARAMRKQEKRATKEERKTLKSSNSSQNMQAKGNCSKFDIAIDESEIIVKPASDSNGTDIVSLIQEGANIEFDELNAKLEMLGI